MEELIILITGAIAGMAAYAISIILGKGAVFGSAIVVLLSGFFLPHIFGDLGTDMAVIATTASYAGMVATKNVPKLLDMAMVGLVCGILYIPTADVFAGVGGRLGTIAAIACLFWMGVRKAYFMLASNQANAKTGKTMDRMQ